MKPCKIILQPHRIIVNVDVRNHPPPYSNAPTIARACVPACASEWAPAGPSGPMGPMGPLGPVGPICPHDSVNQSTNLKNQRYKNTKKTHTNTEN